MTLKDTRVLPVSWRTADAFMQQNEILGNVGLGVYHFGLFSEDSLLGVVSFGTCCFSSTRGFLALLGERSGGHLMQLCRGGCSLHAPRNSASRLVSHALREIYQRKGKGIVVAYSDQRIGEIGTIYQATNAIYTGLTRPKGQANYRINGQLLSAWQVRKRFGTRDRNKLANLVSSVEVLPLQPKHRYVFVVGPPRYRRWVKKALTPHIKPYQKRRALGVQPMPSPRGRGAAEFAAVRFAEAI